MTRCFSPATRAGNGEERNVKKRGEGVGVIFTFFFSVFFSTELIRSSLSNKKSSRGVRGHAPPENF